MSAQDPFDRRLARFEAEQLHGLSPSLPGFVGRFWDTGRNLIFNERSVQPMPGQTLLFQRPESLPILGFASNRPGDVPTLWFGNRTTLYSYTDAGGPVADAAVFTGTDLDLWSIEAWGDWAVATNGVNEPQVDKGAGFGALGGTPPATIGVFVKYKNFMLGFNLASAPTDFAWSDIDDLEDWVPVAANAAGSLTARDVDSAITAAKLFGDMVAFYTQNEMRGARDIGPPYFIGQFPLLEGIGAVGKAAVANLGRLHIGWGRNGIWRTDGASYEYIDRPDLFDYIQSDINNDRLAGITSWVLPGFPLVVFSYPTADSIYNNTSVAINPLTRDWTILGFGRTATLDASEFRFPISGSSAGDVYFMSIEHVPAGQEPDPIVSTASAFINFRTLKGFGELAFGEIAGYVDTVDG